MSATLREPLIKVERAWSKDAKTQELTAYVEREDDPDEKRKVVNHVAIDDGTRGIEHLVAHTMEQFDRHAKESQLSGAEQFRDFAKCLDAATLRMWNQVVQYDPGYPEADQTNYGFNKGKKELSDKVCGCSDMRDTQLYWMSHKMKKPKEMSPRDFYFRFKEILAVSLKLGGYFQTPNEHETKTMLFRAFPTSYQVQFQLSAMTLEDKTQDEIVMYFQKLHDNESKKGLLSSKSNKRNKRDGDDDDDRPRTSNKKQRGRDKHNKSNDKNGGKGRSSGAKWNEQCPLHPNNEHTWGQCRSNPSSKNFKPLDGSFKRRGDNRDDDRDKKKSKYAKGESKRSGDAHHYDVDEHHSGSKNHKRSRSRRRSSYSDDSDATSVGSNHYHEQSHHSTRSSGRVTSSIFDELGGMPKDE